MWVCNHIYAYVYGPSWAQPGTSFSPGWNPPCKRILQCSAVVFLSHFLFPSLFDFFLICNYFFCLQSRFFFCLRPARSCVLQAESEEVYDAWLEAIQVWLVVWCDKMEEWAWSPSWCPCVVLLPFMLVTKYGFKLSVMSICGWTRLIDNYFVLLSAQCMLWVY